MFTLRNAMESGGTRAMTLPPGGAALRPQLVLGGYDLVWAMAPQTLRGQLAALQKSGRLPSEVNVGDLEEAGLVIGGEGDDQVRLAPPQLSMDGEAPRSACLELEFISGNMRFFNGFGNRTSVLKQSVAGWKLAFNVKLQLTPVTLADALVEALSTGNMECAHALRRFDGARYHLHALSLDLADSDLLRADSARTALDTDNEFLASNFTSFIAAWLKGLAADGYAFLLAYAAVRGAPGDDVLARLEAGGVSVAAAGTLNLLCMLGRKANSDGRGMASASALAALRPGYAPGCAARAVLSRDVFFKEFLKPLLVGPIQQRLNQLADYTRLRHGQPGTLDRDESFCDRSGVSATLDNGARAVFVANSGGWGYRDQVQLQWNEGNRIFHKRISEQELQFSVTVSTQPDGAGVPRLTIDLSSSLMRYEWDRASQKMALFNRQVNLGKGWARSTMHWSLRLQLLADDGGAVRVAAGGKRAPAATDSGAVDVYASDALAHLLNMNKLSNDWECNPASLPSLLQDVVPAFSDGVTTLCRQLAGQLVLPAGPQPGCRGIAINDEGNIEIDLGW